MGPETDLLWGVGWGPTPADVEMGAPAERMVVEVWVHTRRFSYLVYIRIRSIA